MCRYPSFKYSQASSVVGSCESSLTTTWAELLTGKSISSIQMQVMYLILVSINKRVRPVDTDLTQMVINKSRRPADYQGAAS